LLNRLAERYGVVLESDDGDARVFPEPGDLAAAHPASLRRPGFSRHKADAILGLARAVTAGGVKLKRNQRSR